MLIPFTKMHGNGNDFVLLDNRGGTLPLHRDRVRRLADRRFGIGFDQLLVAEPPANGAAAVAMRIFNADGSEAGQCGNGLRCFARYVRGLGIGDGDCLQVETPGGVVAAELLDAGRVRASVGVPELDPQRVPMNVSGRRLLYPLRVDGEVISVCALSVGNPHAVVRVEDVAAAPVARLGPAIQALAEFPEGVNVGFMQLLSPAAIRLRVFERGVGETLACGSGACAAVVAGRLQGLLDESVEVTLPGGALQIHWPGEGREVVMEGPTEVVFMGEVDL